MHEGTHPAPEEGIYGHEVVNLLLEFGGSTTVESLRSAAAAAFGADAVFCNCHGGRFNFDQVLKFLASAGKLESDGHTVRLGFSPACGGH